MVSFCFTIRCLLRCFNSRCDVCEQQMRMGAIYAYDRNRDRSDGDKRQALFDRMVAED